MSKLEELVLAQEAFLQDAKDEFGGEINQDVSLDDDFGSSF